MIFGKRRGDGVVIVEKRRHGGAEVAGRNRGVEAWRSGCIMDIKNVPSSLVDEIAPILGVANEIQSDNPRVSYICRFYALERAHTLDPISSGYRVRQFKDALLLHLERENKATSRGERNSDAHVIQAFYLHFNRNYMHSLQNADKVDRIRVAKDYQKASVLFEAMKAVSLSDSIEVPNEILEAHAEMYIHNMLTLHPESSNQTREKLPEILEAQMKQTNHHKIPLQTIKDCTQEFDEKNLIGNGGYGRVYKGILSWAHEARETQLGDEEDEFLFRG
ncbi:unnamed protein product [Lactuca virosa]|uniref:Vta1/callose synthase N-terminal domain-containing protein n=1 Tax=Lactuca virosa TaxID=75947 RepID=A0AAU9NSP8_9ASTR|nr:unnamed protein product [Lactuca virosa]